MGILTKIKEKLTLMKKEKEKKKENEKKFLPITGEPLEKPRPGIVRFAKKKQKKIKKKNKKKEKKK